MKALTMVLMVALGGCASQAPPLVQTVRITAPAQLLTCKAQPVPPEAFEDDAALADFVLALAEAGADCRSKLGTVAKLVGGASSNEP